MIDNHDLDGHGGHVPSCRQCRLDTAIYALKHAAETTTGYIQVPRQTSRGDFWMDARQLAKQLEERA